MHPRSLRCALLCGLFLLSSCAGLKLGADGLRLEVSSAQIQRNIDRSTGFPMHRELGSLARLQVDQARLLLVPKDNSLGVSLPVKVHVLGRSWSGLVAFTARPVYERSTGTIYLTDFALREIQVSGLPADLGKLAAQAVTAILNESVRRYDVYRLDRSKFGEMLGRLVLKDIRVREDAVVFHLGP
jgi:Protein of unknown function (DUF1439)